LKLSRKIMFLITGLDHAGAEMLVLELAAGLNSRGWSVQVVSMIKPTLDLGQHEKAGIVFNHLNMVKGVPDPRAIWKLRRLILDFKPEIIHSHMIHANLLARVSRLFTSIPILVSTAHNTNEGGRLRMMLYRLTDPLCELMTNVSHDAVESFIRKKASPKGKIICVPNGVNSQRFQKNELDRTIVRRELDLTDEFVWLSVGRLSKEKDYPTLLNAWACIVRVQPNCRLLIAGEGEDREMLAQLADKLGVGDYVQFLGIRDDIPRLMNSSDAYVMSSLWEGMPMVLLEASACELPIVATDVGGNREVVQDDVSGYLQTAADADRLAQSMVRMMSLPEEARKEMGRRGREYVLSKYDIDAILFRWESLYGDLIASRFSTAQQRGGVV
jgi:glycosyltransferase involved in cell wall biosynthesis